MKEKDFVYVSYTGKLEDGFIFETTDEEIAKKNSLYQKNKTYGPTLISIGSGQLLPGLDKSLLGKKENESYTVTLDPIEAFGKKRTDAIKLIPASHFKKQNIQLYPGLQVTVNDQPGIVKTISGNRALIDFNHPLSGYKVIYDVTIGSIEKNLQKQVESVVKGIPGLKVESKDKDITILTPFPLPEQYQKIIETQIKNACDVNTISFVEEKKEVTKTPSEPQSNEAQKSEDKKTE